MNRKVKGWLAEAAVKRYYESTGLFEVRNLAQTEPASDLLIIDKNSGAVVAEIEVKYGRQPGNLDLGEKRGIWEAHKRCEALGRLYGLYCVIPTLGPRGQPVALRSYAYTIKALEPSKVRKGLSLRVFNTGSVDLPMPEGGQGGKSGALPSLTTSRAESGPLLNPLPLKHHAERAGVGRSQVLESRTPTDSAPKAPSEAPAPANPHYSHLPITDQEAGL